MLLKLILLEVDICNSNPLIILFNFSTTLSQVTFADIQRAFTSDATAAGPRLRAPGPPQRRYGATSL